MLKDWLIRNLPNRETLRGNLVLRPVAHLLQQRELWVFNRRSVTAAVFVGLFSAFLPVPSQMLVAAIIAVIVRINLPVAVGLVWITNPITIAPMFYFAFRLGAWLMDLDVADLNLELSLTWLLNNWAIIGTPLLLGSLICAWVAGISGYVIAHFIWRNRVIAKWRRRKRRRAFTEKPE